MSESSRNTSSGTLPNIFRLILDRTTLLPTSRLDTEDYLEFSGIPDVNIQKSAVYHEDQVTGRSEPYRSYNYSTPTQISFTGKIVATGSPKGGNIPMEVLAGGLGLVGRFVSGTAPFIGPAGKLGTHALNALTNDQGSDVAAFAWVEVKQKADWLEALTYPQYDDAGRAYPPPLCWIQFGQNFTRRGVLKSVTLDYHGPWEPLTLLSMYVEAQCTFEEVSLQPKGYLDVRNAYTRGFEKANLATGSPVRAVIDNVRSVAGL